MKKITMEKKKINYSNEYSSLKEDYYKGNKNQLQVRKLAFSSLFLGLTNDAYHWSLSLNFYGLPYAQKSRQKRLELFLGIKKSEDRSQLLAGIVRKASFTQSDHCPPDAGDMLELNPHRKEIIKKYMNWKGVSNKVIKVFTYSPPTHIKDNISPFAFEPGVDMKFPPEYEDVPSVIIGYWYYSGFIYLNNEIKEVVFRYPEYPHNDQEVELFFEDNSENCVEVFGGENVACYFLRKDEVLDKNWIECKLKIYSIFSRRPQQFGKDQSFYQGHEIWGLPGQRPTMHRLENYGLERWLRPEHEVLDIGCNIGCLGIEVSKKVKKYIGFDNNPEVIEVANILSNFHDNEKCEFLLCDFNQFLRKNNKKYDFLFSFAVHHWIGLEMHDYVKLLKSMIVKGGFVLVESHDLKSSYDKFMKDMKYFVEEGFVILEKGRIKDDGVIARSFFILQKVLD